MYQPDFQLMLSRVLKTLIFNKKKWPALTEHQAADTEDVDLKFVDTALNKPLALA